MWFKKASGPRISSGTTVSGQRQARPVEQHLSPTYRPVMFRLSNILPPNPRLQRTRLRSPLSRKPLGRSKTKRR